MGLDREALRVGFFSFTKHGTNENGKEKKRSYSCRGRKEYKKPVEGMPKKTDDAFCKQRNPESNVCGMEWDMIVDKIYVDGVDGKSRKRRPDRRVQNSKKWA